MNRTITQLIILARTFADELENMLAGPCGQQQLSGEGTSNEAATAPVKRTRGPNKPKEPQTPADPPATLPPEQQNVPAEGMTLEELQALIDKPVKAGIGAQVKELIAKHGGTQLANLPVAAHAAFKADVEALVY